ncbi:carboxylate/amino acid/amine transporter [Vibrio gallicus]|uniref:carboxylate/amino acid/amine transporter n=1 Tax=Vibrio gallicus TaxID=190897 RepID=UPI0021C40580|nr:carboxylate/amino acid/amine transporter [Vibrio gallicus]
MWSLSFSLIGVYLAGQVDAYVSVWLRIALAALVFVPLLRIKAVSSKEAIQLMAIGGIQLGLMYIFYYQSFLLLSVPEVLIFTVFTPIYVTLIYDALNKQFNPWYLLTALIAVAGAVVIRYDSITENYLVGFLVVQCSNLCFAFGQVGYKYFKESRPQMHQKEIFGWFYIGALIIVSIAWLLWGKAEMPTQPLQLGILLWLGVGASGVGYFLWNRGASKVDPGYLAIMNNALIPAGLIVNVTIWNRDEDIPRLIIGGMIILLALFIHSKIKRNSPSSKQV